MSAEEWLLPSIGDIDSARTALEMAALSLTQRRPKNEPRQTADVGQDQLGELVGAAVSLANLCALLLIYIEAASKREGRPVSALALLDTIRTHEQARADLASLDEPGGPFDAS